MIIKLVDMRYEGSARRSQTYNKTIVDKIWNFFSSVKIGVTLIVITLIASAVGYDFTTGNVYSSINTTISNFTRINMDGLVNYIMN